MSTVTKKKAMKAASNVSKPKPKVQTMVVEQAVSKSSKKRAKAKVSKAKKEAVAEAVKEGVVMPGPLYDMATKGGKMLGGLFGMSGIGEAAGRGVGHFLNQVTGIGDYEINTNSIINPMSAVSKDGEVPGVQFRNGKHCVILKEREFLGDIISSSSSNTFQQTSYRLNAGMFSTFPWLSTVADSFEQWEPLGIVFEYRPTSSAWNGVNQALGKVIFATDYNSLDAVYQNAIQMENSEYANSVVSNQQMFHGIECAPAERSNKVYYIRSGTIPTGGTILDYDLGNFQVGTTGVNGTSVNLGELWVSYEIALYKKDLFAGQIGGTNLTFTARGTAGIANNKYWGTDTKFGGTMWVTLGSTTVTFPKWLQTGVFWCVHNIVGTAAAITVPTVTYTSNCAVNDWGSAVTSSIASVQTQTGTTTANLIFAYCLTIKGPNAVVTLSGGVLPTNPNVSDFYIVQLSGYSAPVLTADPSA